MQQISSTIRKEILIRLVKVTNAQEAHSIITIQQPREQEFRVKSGFSKQTSATSTLDMRKQPKTSKGTGSAWHRPTWPEEKGKGITRLAPDSGKKA
jgi:hypothetical protein